jgi:hypothetical protein
MKAKERIPEKCEQPKTLPTPSNEERQDELAPWQKQIVALAEARLSIDGEQDVIFQMHERAIGLCRVVEDFSLVGDDNDLSMHALGKLMEVVGEDIKVAKWIAMGMPLGRNWY